MSLKISDKLKGVKFPKVSVQRGLKGEEKIDIDDSADIENFQEENSDAQIAKSPELQERL